MGLELSPCQKIHSKMYAVFCTNTHNDDTDLVYHRMVKNTKTWTSQEWNITFLWNKKILNLRLRWQILRSYCFVVEITFKLHNLFWIIFWIIFWGEWPSVLRHYTENWKDSSSNPTRCSTRLWNSMRPPVTFGSNQESNALINIGLVRLPLSYIYHMLDFKEVKVQGVLISKRPKSIFFILWKN